MFLIWKRFFTGELPLNAFICYFEKFFHITTNLVDFQLMPTPKFYHVHTDLGIPKAAEIKEKEDLQIMLKWGKLFFNLTSRKFHTLEK